ncbi:MAG TPA: pyruvate:ferredoxin (flavodoxin) oxidoreductase [Candidatus Deferrimicrobiaceae bacterium]|nr:pyruvate:ferredoxin (flavodoxin) oxidoreductase [Candidatus Deferrimicrobiaceae bacterium]
MLRAPLADTAATASARRRVTLDGNEAAAHVAYQLSEVIAIYPITPSSAMGEWADQWAAQRRPNLWGTVPTVVEMQSEGGAAGALHGALQSGALATTFTASQGLLLMIPNMYKIAGELTATVFHVAARSLATQALSIFGDHSDVMAARATGFAMLASGSVQEAMDLALIAQAATLEARVPFLHFFDGFRTSHEVAKVEPLAPAALRAMIRDDLVRAHRARALSPDHPVIRGTAQNPDVYFQARETANPYYLACPTIVQSAMDRLAGLVGRRYRLFDYAGAPDARRVIVIMGSGAETAQETVEHLVGRGEKVGVLRVRLYRPFSAEHFLAALPATVRTLAVLDRTKEPGSVGEPLYLDVVATMSEAAARGRGPFSQAPRVIGGRYGLGSKEFTPAMVKGIFEEMAQARPRAHFTIGIQDDVTHTSLAYDASFSTEDPATVRAIFYGLGSDGTVGANKNSIKIIGEQTDNYAQGYFVYDSKKSGSVTVSHLRFGPQPIRSTYLISRATFVACHQFSFLERFDVLREAEPGAVFLLNSPYGAEAVWDHLPRTVQRQIIDKRLRVFVIDGNRVAREAGMGGRVNTVMQACFFAISGVLPRDEAVAAIKRAIEKTYGRRGAAVVRRNWEAVDAALGHLSEVTVPGAVTGRADLRPPVPAEAPRFVQEVTARMIAGEGDALPVSALPADGTYPTGTTQWEKRNIAQEIPAWDEALCIQCGKCVLVCPHAVIRAKVYAPARLEGAPPAFKSAPARWREFGDARYTLQVSPEDCTGCGLCVEVCPAKSKSEARHKAIDMTPQAPLHDQEAASWRFFLGLPETDRHALNPSQVKDAQLLQPLFEFSGACAGCGETPYLKLISQLFGDRAVIANATGCSSIYGGNQPTTPWTVNRDGRGPAWANSLFEDNAEFGLGMRIALDKQAEYARELLRRLGAVLGDLGPALLGADQSSEAGIETQRERVARLKVALEGLGGPEARELLSVAGALVKKSVWIVGGDGWAYDIGFGGLDHVLASGLKVNILVLDTEVYSNTGGQMSKATPRAAVAKFAAGGKATAKKDLALMAMTYGNAYVARVAMGGNDAQTLRAFREAEAYPGPSLIIAYSHCIAHGYDLRHGMDQQKAAVLTGHWPLLRYNPGLAREGRPTLELDSKAPSVPLKTYAYNETRYTMLAHSDPEAARRLLEKAQEDVLARWRIYEQWAALFSERAAGGER